MLQDRFNRVHHYLRISLTDNCNLRCTYCMPEDEYDFTPASRLMQPEEIASIARIFVENGVDKIRLTGGEPLVRKDAAEIIQRLAELPVALTLTTNGTRLDAFARQLQLSGVTSLNISLDTLDRDKFILLTKRDQFDRVYGNIQSMLEMGFHVKINVVVMRHINDGEILDFIRWTRRQPIHVRFIEFMPFTGNHWEQSKVVGWREMLSTISASYPVIPIERARHETAKKFTIEGHQGTFAVISTMSEPFCGDCNRMRLTADGKMKNCLFSATETDLLTAFRRGEDILPLIRDSLAQKEKALGGQFTSDITSVDPGDIHNRSMITIGG